MKRGAGLTTTIAYRAAIALLILVGLGCGRPADARVRAYFDIPRNSAVDSTTIRNAVLRMLPLGTEESDVAAKLRARGVGVESLSSYSAPDSAGHAVVRIEFDPREIAIAKVGFVILLEFDVSRRLKSLEVRPWLTGP